MVQELKNCHYKVRLSCLNLPKLKYRRLLEDMIQVYNILSSKYNTHLTVEFSLSYVSITERNRDR